MRFRSGVLLFLVVSLNAPALAFAEDGWKRDWLVESGFAMEVDAEGLERPTSIVFVPKPGPGPKDPAYFVTELRGKIRVVTNDRTLLTFADLSDIQRNYVPKHELPSGQGQGGLAGLCLDPEHGYVYVTFLYATEGGQLKNGLVRFQSTPTVFNGESQGHVDYSDVFKGASSGLAHHIGPCKVHDGALFVSIGEAWMSYATPDPSNFYGKLVRMSLDGEPLPDNPHYDEAAGKSAVNYVWASGLRNPFGLTLVDGRLFAADNGLAIDRFVEVERGENYRWNGSDHSIATNAKFVWSPSVGPVQMDYVGVDSGLFPPSHERTFYVAMSGWFERKKMPGVFRIQYNLEQGRVMGVPSTFIRYVGETWRMVSGLAVGPDGLYFAYIEPQGDDLAKIFKVTHRPEAAHPYTMESGGSGYDIMTQKGCLGCHVLDGSTYGGGAAPELVRGADLVDRLTPRLTSQAYLAQLDQVDGAADALHRSTRAARDRVRKAQGKERVRAWLEEYVREPQFDKLYKPMMPNLGIKPGEASAIAVYLLGDIGPAARPRGLQRKILKKLKPPYRPKMALLIYALGGLSGVVVTAAVAGLRRRRQKAKAQ